MSNERKLEIVLAESKGLLCVLPVKVGDLAWYIHDDIGIEPSVQSYKIEGVCIQEDGFYILDHDLLDKAGSEFSMLSKEEADNRLANMYLKANQNAICL